MADEYLSRKEYELFEKLMKSENEKLHAEDRRINHRLDAVEENVSQVTALTISVERMAATMEQMVKKQDEIGKRLTNMESEPGKKYNQLKTVTITAFITALVSLLVGFLPRLL